MKTVFIGGGNMAFAIIQGLLKAGTPTGSLHVVEINESARQAIGGLGVDASAEWPIEVDAEVVVMAVKPQVMQTVIEANCTNWKDILLLSIAAGVNTKQLQQWSGQNRVARAMPNTPALVGQGMTGVYYTPSCTASDKAAVNRIFSACGQVISLTDEDEINAVTAISGSGPGYVFFLMDCLRKAAIEQGFSEATAKVLVAQTFLGAASLASQAEDDFLTLQNKVTSKGGTTFAGLEALREELVDQAIAKAASSARTRAAELEKGQS